ncbi:MAG: hypothetical protein Q7S26_04455 [bacterium]|nr:hypothetical protein [bacterium]
MAFTWSGRRQLLYSGVGAVIVFILLIIAYETFFTAPATCFDGKQDGSETGVDCGGNSCSLICADAAHPPVVQWKRAFLTNPGVYSAVAYVQNNNIGAGARNVPYSFALYDSKNILVGHREGVVNIPPLQTVPIIESNIQVGNSVVAHTEFDFTDDPPAIWNKIPAGTYPQLIVSQPTHTGDYSKLSATLINNAVADVKNISVVAILYDQNNTAIETSKSVIPRIVGRSQESLVFTWPQGVPDTVRFEIIVLPSF